MKKKLFVLTKNNNKTKINYDIIICCLQVNQTFIFYSTNLEKNKIFHLKYLYNRVKLVVLGIKQSF